MTRRSGFTRADDEVQMTGIGSADDPTGTRRIAASPADLPDRAALLAVSGMEFMEALASGRRPLPPIAGVMNYYLQSVAQGRAVFRGTPEFAHCNPMGGVHGGWYGTLLDSALGCAVMTAVPKGSWYTTLEYKVNLVRALPPGREVEVVGELQHAGRSTAVAVAEMRGVDGDARLYATGSTTCIIMRG